MLLLVAVSEVKGRDEDAREVARQQFISARFSALSERSRAEAYSALTGMLSFPCSCLTEEGFDNLPSGL